MQHSGNHCNIGDGSSFVRTIACITRFDVITGMDYSLLPDYTRKGVYHYSVSLNNSFL